MGHEELIRNAGRQERNVISCLPAFLIISIPHRGPAFSKRSAISLTSSTG